MSVDVRREDFWENVEEQLAKPEPWERRRMVRLAVRFYGALSAAAGGSDSPKVPPSLATCEQLSSSPAVPRFSEGGLSGENLPKASTDALKVALRLGVDDVERAVHLATCSADAPEVLYRLLERDDPERTELALALMEAGEVAAALRFAACNRQSVQLECPTDFGAGGCGYDENYTPVTCDHLLCPECAKRRMGHGVEKYAPAVKEWEAPTFYTLTIENVSDAAHGVEAVKGAFGRLRQRTIPTAGETEREGAVKRWAWSNDGGRPAELWKPRLLDAGRDELVRRLQKQYVSEGRNIPFKELVRGGFYGVDVKQKGPSEFNVHVHVLADAAYIPQAALSAVWEQLTGAPVVDVRRIYERDGGSIESAVLETVAYAVKAPEFDEVETAVEFAVSMKGKRLVQPFGSLHGNTPRVSNQLLCGRCECTPRWWNYLGLVDGHHSTMGSVHGCDGDRPPPEEP